MRSCGRCVPLESSEARETVENDEKPRKRMEHDEKPMKNGLLEASKLVPEHFTEGQEARILALLRATLLRDIARSAAHRVLASTS